MCVCVLWASKQRFFSAAVPRNQDVFLMSLVSGIACESLCVGAKRLHLLFMSGLMDPQDSIFGFVEDALVCVCVVDKGTAIFFRVAVVRSEDASVCLCCQGSLKRPDTAIASLSVENKNC